MRCFPSGLAGILLRKVLGALRSIGAEVHEGHWGQASSHRTYLRYVQFGLRPALPDSRMRLTTAHLWWAGPVGSRRPPPRMAGASSSFGPRLRSPRLRSRCWHIRDGAIGFWSANRCRRLRGRRRWLPALARQPPDCSHDDGHDHHADEGDVIGPPKIANVRQ